MRFSDSFLEEIRARLPISQVVGRHVQWDRKRSHPSRGDYWACCPFHHEKTPSFHVDDRKGFYYCFGCHAKGDHFRFLTEKEGLSFAEAVAQLASEAGLELPRPDPKVRQREEKRLGLMDVLEEAARFYEQQLRGEAGREALDYALYQRGLTEETLRTFRIGAAPDARDALYRHLKGRAVDVALMEEAGLVARPEDGGAPYDRFRNRLMFPIRDVKGRVIAFGGRALGEARAKYLNSPETPVFHKSRVLFNLDQARQPAFERGSIVAVEGYMDAIALHQAGLAHVVAPLGTALTEVQLAMLWRVAAQPVLCFDGDAAGLKAAWRALEVALPHLQPGHSLRFAFLPQGMDPDDMLREQGVEAFAEVLEKAEPMIGFLFRHEASGHPAGTPEEKAALEARLEELAGRIGDHKVRQHYLQELRERLREIFGHGRATGRSGRGRGGRGAVRGGRFGGAGQGTGRSRRFVAPPSARLKQRAGNSGDALGPLAEQDLLRMLLLRPDIVDEVAEALAEFSFSSAALDSLARAILDIASAGTLAECVPTQALDSAVLLDHLQGRPEARVAVRLMAGESVRRLSIFTRSDAAQAARLFLRRLREVDEARALRRELARAEEDFASAPTEENLARLQQLRAELDALAQTHD